MAKKKVIDESNPALQFITGSQNDAAQPSAEAMQPNVAAVISSAQTEVPTGYKLNPMFLEVKSKRVQLIMQPSLFERTKEAADRKGISLNEYVHRALKYALDNNVDLD